jgi:predicted transcriptional regulator
MTAVDLKNILHHRIAAINDEQFLSAMLTILDAKKESTVYQTTDEQKAKIKEGREQISRGESLTDKQVETEIEEWLNKA